MTIKHSPQLAFAILVFAIGSLSGCVWSTASLATIGAVLASQQLSELLRLVQPTQVSAPC